MNVLMVDDEPFVLEQLELLIKPVVPLWRLYTAIDSSQALELFRKINFQLVFLDIELPGRSGLEVADLLRRKNKNVEIVILTAHQDFNYAKQSINLGVSAYLTKPIIQEELNKIVERHAMDIESRDYSDIVLKALHTVHNRYNEKLTLADVGEEIHVNQSYLSRKFKNETGMSFSEHLIDYRIEKAKNLLLSHNHCTISDIADVTGFTSLHYFSTSFKKKVGLSPKQYQGMKKGG